METFSRTFRSRESRLVSKALKSVNLILVSQLVQGDIVNILVNTSPKMQHPL